MNVREWALPVYTILMQLSVGTLLALWLIRAVGIRHYGQTVMAQILRLPMLAIFITVTVAIIGSHFHLSHPILSLLATLNVRSSWLSREIISTVSFFLVAGLLTYLQWFVNGYTRLKMALGWLGIVIGSLSIYCMSQIYLLPTHSSWNSPLTSVSFLLTALILGVMTIAVLLIIDFRVSEEASGEAETVVRKQLIRQSFVWLSGVALVIAVFSLAINLKLISDLSRGGTSAQTSLVLMLGLYQPLLGLRYIALFTGVGWFGLITFALYQDKKRLHEITSPVYLACLLVLIAEILGRFLFYATHVRVGI